MSVIVRQLESVYGYNDINYNRFKNIEITKYTETTIDNWDEMNKVLEK
ncbi:MAG: hypothetical protein ACLTK8_00080 [Paeniclostridium sp.]